MASWSYVDATGTTVTLAEGDVINTAGMSALNPLQATYTVGSGDCADSATYLIIIESSYDAVLAPNVAACESELMVH